MVYGAYLIDKKLGKYSISYFCRNQKRRTFELNVNSPDEVEKWIVLDDRRQIIDQFSFLWHYLKSEIETCFQENYTKLPTELLSNDYIIDQINSLNNIVTIYL